MDYDFYEIKNKLKLNDWDENNVLSPSMKDFFKLIINKLSQNESDVLSLKNEILLYQEDLRIVEEYLDYKSFRSDYFSFKNFRLENPSSSYTEIKAFFRKQKIKKILNEEI